MVRAQPLPAPEPAAFADLLGGSGRQEVSTTMAFARLLRSLTRDPGIGGRIVPIVSDEARTFGLESLISEVQIYAPDGQRYTPVDAGLALHYAESAAGQILEEGITEAGATATFTAAATSYATWGESLIPCYLFYSMFGFQRVGDLLWALGDSRGRGFLLGCTAGRTTLERRGPPAPGRPFAPAGLDLSVGRGLRPGVRLRGGDDRGGRDPADDRARARGPLLVPHPLQRELRHAGAAGRSAPRPSGSGRAPSTACTASPERRTRYAESAPRATLLFSGTAWLAAMEARRLLAEDWGVGAEAWSVTSYKSLREEALSAERHNRLHPDDRATGSARHRRRWPVHAGPSWPSPTSCGPFPTRWPGGCPGRFTSLGTDGFGRSDTREVLRRFFEVDAAHVVVAVLEGLPADGVVPAGTVTAALARYGIDADCSDPWSD